MKKVLVTGAGGSIGLSVIKYLLSEGKYEITALDLKNKKSIKNLKRYKRRINIVFGDILDSTLIEALVKDHDYIIHLASIMPPLGELSKKVGEIVEYDGTLNIIKSINYYNEKCFLMYASTTSMYTEDEAKVSDKIDIKNISNYALNKYKTEELIKNKLKNYTIFRLPLILNNIKTDPFMYNVSKNKMCEVSTVKDVAYAFVKGIDYKKELNKKIFNVGMGKSGIIKYNDILINILKYYGISMKYIASRIFLEKNYQSPVLLDSDVLDNIIHYQSDTTYNYFKQLKRIGKKRRIRKFMAKPLIWLKEKE